MNNNEENRIDKETLNYLSEFAYKTYELERHRTDSLDTKIALCLSALFVLLTAGISIIPFKTILANYASFKCCNIVFLTLGTMAGFFFIILYLLSVFYLYSAYKTEHFKSLPSDYFTSDKVFELSNIDLEYASVNRLGEIIEHNRLINNSKADKFDKGFKSFISSVFLLTITLLLLTIAAYI